MIDVGSILALRRARDRDLRPWCGPRSAGIVAGMATDGGERLVEGSPGGTPGGIEHRVRPWYRRRGLVGGVAAFNAVAAWGGAIALLGGATDFGETATARLPFESLVLAGLALAVAVAVPLSVLAWAEWRGTRWADSWALLAGVVLIGWILLQIVVLRTFSFFQPTYLLVGAYFVLASGRLGGGRHRREVAA